MTTITTEVLDRDLKRDRQGRRITPAARRLELVTGYRTSGLTMEQFAKREGINRLTLAKWVYLQDQRGKTKPAVRFAEVKMGLPLPTRWAFELTLPSGWVVRAADAAAVAQLLSVTTGN